mmetsp:Transcript_13431/g.31622  ORF Transcript_13431/g.31622 Transcript_13431/m.31622 type:complete len:90 (+) Transcript_13431:1502-1771(+)
MRMKLRERSEMLTELSMISGTIHQIKTKEGNERGITRQLKDGRARARMMMLYYSPIFLRNTRNVSSLSTSCICFHVEDDFLFFATNEAC